MAGSGQTPKYAIRLVAVVGIAPQPVSYAGSGSCGASGCPNHSPPAAEPDTERSKHISFTGAL